MIKVFGPNGGTGATTVQKAFKNLTGRNLDLNTEAPHSTWFLVSSSSDSFAHRVLPELPWPVSAGDTGAATASGAVSNLSGGKSIILVYRAYNQYNGGYIWEVSLSEYNKLISQGWTGEGITFYVFN